jgi:hypothetical protein
MSLKINTININNETLMSRSVDAVDQAQSIRVNPIDATFLVSNPIAEDDESGNVIIYPQNPNNSDYSIKTIKTIVGHGDLNFPLDAVINVFTGTYWILDAGNEKVVVLDSDDYSFLRSVEGFTLPHSIIVNPNSRTVFVKSFEDKLTQRVTQLDNGGKILFNLEVPGLISSTTIDYSSSYMGKIPKYFTMDFDLARNRLWFVSKAVLYMIDLDTKQITENDLEDGRLNKLDCVSIDRSSGNAFVIMTDGVNYYVKQIFKDNNLLLGTSYLEEQPLP